jgi:hypothetical protein
MFSGTVTISRYPLVIDHSPGRASFFAPFFACISATTCHQLDVIDDRPYLLALILGSWCFGLPSAPGIGPSP